MILQLLHFLLLGIGILICVPIALLLAECLLSLQRQRKVEKAACRPSLAVVIPAHNEAAVLADTLQSIRGGLRSGDRLLVVADNCSDATADIARSFGAEVVERTDRARRGKGYALQTGIDALNAEPPAIVLFTDADTCLQPDTIDELVRTAHYLRRPVQARNVLHASANAGATTIISAFAFTMKNVVRPLGLKTLGCGCPLTGVGVAMPWSLVQAVNVASGELAEDMQWGVELLLRGYPAYYCYHARIQGMLPTDQATALQQRTRWEHGHLNVIRHTSLRLLVAGLRRCKSTLILSALDYAIPPLALLCLIWGVVFVITGIWTLATDGWLPLAILSGAGIALGLAVLIGWFGHARHLPLCALLAVPFYIVWKLPIYLRYLVRPQTVWIRTARQAEQ